jgi:acetyl-CoA synthetase
MLPNRVELWEIMLAGIKLGAVLVPTTMLVSPADLEDRLQRGHIRHVIAQASEAHKFETLAGDYTRIAVGCAMRAVPMAGPISPTARRQKPSSRPTA